MKNVLIILLILLVSSNSVAMEKSYSILCEEDEWVYDQDNFIARIKRAGFNVAIINVLHGDGVKWLSKDLPTYYQVAGKQYPATDPLKSFIEKARANGIKTWVWFCVSLRREYTPYNNMWSSIAYWYFDLRDVEYRKYILSAVGEVIAYNPDGVFLDFIRMGVDGLPESEQVVGSLVTDIHRTIKDYNPKIIISAFGAESSYQGANTSRWLDYGLIDVWIIGTYETAATSQRLNQIYGATSKPNQVMILADNYYPDPSSGMDVVKRLASFGQQNMKGLYWYRSLTDEQINALRRYAGWWK